MGIDEILKDKRDAILRIASKYGAANVRVFGSIARGEANPDSDVDFLVEFDRTRSLFDHAGMIVELADLLNCTVDVVPAKSLRARIRERVLAEAVPL